jgi:hypothetical protein
MPRYLAVAAVQHEGRPVGTWSAAAADASPPARPAVPRGSCLVAVVNNGEWQSAIDVTYADYYARLRRRCGEGVWRALSLYLVDEERARQIEDGRRVLMDGTPVRDPGRALRDA